MKACTTRTSNRLRCARSRSVKETDQVDCEIICIVAGCSHPVCSHSNRHAKLRDSTQGGANTAVPARMSIGAQRAEPAAIHHAADRVRPREARKICNTVDQLSLTPFKESIAPEQFAKSSEVAGCCKQVARAAQDARHRFRWPPSRLTKGPHLPSRPDVGARCL